MPWPFQLHHTYNRRSDIHARYGGQQQGGISTPSSAPGIFIFTGHGADSIGYQDTFQRDGCFRYTGQGQSGDMRMISGNRAIRDHAQNGKDILLFRQLKKGGLVCFEGLFVCAGWEWERQQDHQGEIRQAIVFTLTPQNGLSFEAEDLSNHPRPLSSITELRYQALNAAKTPQQSDPKQALNNVYKRSKAVRDYVLFRANGICESCKNPAPFQTSSGVPYLEAHHIHRVSDGGPDHPAFVAAICPNCHRGAHFGAERNAVNAKMLEIIHAREAEIEASLGTSVTDNMRKALSRPG